MKSRELQELADRVFKLEDAQDRFDKQLHEAGLLWYRFRRPQANPLKTQATLNLLLKHLGLKVVHVDEDRIVPIDARPEIDPLG